MPIVSGVAFGITLPYNRIHRSISDYIFSKPVRPGNIRSLLDFGTRASYKYNRASRLVNQYSLYNKKIDTPTIGTIVSIEF